MATVVGPLDPHMVIWGILKGHHDPAVRAALPDATLYEQPDLTDAAANATRAASICRAPWLQRVHDYVMDAAASGRLNLVNFSALELALAIAPWTFDGESPVTILQAAAWYRAYSTKSTLLLPGDKSAQNIAGVSALRQSAATVGPPPVPTTRPGFVPSDPADFHRSLWLRQNGSYQILDGTHRLVAIAWHYILEQPSAAPLPFQCFMIG